MTPEHAGGDLSALRERVEKATGASYELECAIRETLEPDVRAGWSPPAYLCSIDAALALVERCLPHWTTDVHTADATPEAYPIVIETTMEIGGGADCEISYQHPKMEARLIGDGYGPTLPLAILSALLTALEQQP